MSQKKNPSFVAQPLTHGIVSEEVDPNFPSRLSAFVGEMLRLEDDGTHYGYVFDGIVVLSVPNVGTFLLTAGMYFAVPGDAVVFASPRFEGEPEGRGIVITRKDYYGVFSLGGPIEDEGRLNYIDGCTDSLLIPPVKFGDPCLNALYFPRGIVQTQHTHPSVRVGMTVAGGGMCITPQGNVPLVPGDLFIITAEGLHSFETVIEPKSVYVTPDIKCDGYHLVPNESGMTVIAYHPDSDFGPRDEDHPMINRTIVGGVSAAALDEIRTK